MHERLASDADTGALLAFAASGLSLAASGLPAPPYALVRPYSNVTVVAAPFEDTVPFNVAPLAAIALAASVTAVGAPPGQADVVNVTSLPSTGPPLPLSASTRA